MIRASARGGRDARLMFLAGHQMWDGPAEFFEAREVPEIRKVPALLRLDRLDAAIDALEKNTFAIGFFLEREIPPAGGEAGEALDKIVLGQVEERGKPADFFIAQSHLTWPSAAGGAALAFIEDRHGWLS